MVYVRIRYEDGFIREEENPIKLYGLRREGKRPIHVDVYDDGSFPAEPELSQVANCVYKQLRMVIAPTIVNGFSIDESTILGLQGEHSSQIVYGPDYAKAY